MKTATVHELKQELLTVSPKQLIELTVRLAKFKKDNKELLTYLLFEAQDEEAYIEGVMKEMEHNFAEINFSSLYYVKKTFRKIIRTTTKYIRYSADPNTEIRLLAFVCEKMKASGVKMEDSPVISNMYQSQIKKIRKVIDGLHEDLQYDYLQVLEKLEYGGRN